MVGLCAYARPNLRVYRWVSLRCIMHRDPARPLDAKNTTLGHKTRSSQTYHNREHQHLGDDRFPD